MAYQPIAINVPVPMVAGPKVPAALSLALLFFSFFLCFFTVGGGVLLRVVRVSTHVFAVTTKCNTTEQPTPNGNDMFVFLVHPYTTV